MWMKAYCKPGLAMTICATLLFLSACVTSDKGRLADQSQYDLFLLIGQSNMSGRGLVSDVDKTVHERVKLLNQAGDWVAATDPMHFDKPSIVGVGPGLTFGKMLAQRNESIVVGLIPAAVGGSSLATWVPGGFHVDTRSFPYDDAIRRARLAAQSGQLRAVLWHQGESDVHPETVKRYATALAELVANIRRDLGAPDLPFIVGGLGEYLEDRLPESATLTQILADVPNQIAHTGFVSASGLVHNGDGTHFSAPSARELGRRYADKYVEMSG